MPEIEFFELTGSTRTVNEDAIGHWPLDDGLVFAVADGLGEEATGQVASSLALDVLGREMAAAPAHWSVINRLRRAVQAANVEIYQKGITVPDLRGMGTTLTATALVGSTLVSAHVGDCRLWLLRHGSFTQLTKDHTWVWAHLPGVLPSEQARRHPRRYSLPRCLGHELIVTIDLLTLDLKAGDVVAQCSDGIHAALSEGEIRELLEAHPPDAACRALVRRARESDGNDDLSVQVAAVGVLPPVPPRPWWRFWC